MSKCNPITRIIPASFAWLVLLFSTGVFFAFPCRYLMSAYSIAIPVFQSIVTFFVTINFGLATFVNPGAIPKAASDEIKHDKSSATYKDIEIRGVRIRLKWCVTCQFYRPPRCVHCGVCDTCIETFDHHCPWVNNCIGRRNYRYFFMFLLWLTIHMISILSLCALYMKDHLGNIKQLETIMTLSIIGIIILLFIPIFGLTGYHTMLIIQGLTTNEQVTGKFIDVRSPYSKGCLKNILYSLCTSPLPRYKSGNSVNELVNYYNTKYMKEVRRGSETSNSHKVFGMQYQFVGKSDYILSNRSELFECDQLSGPSLLNRGSLHLSLNEAICAKYPDSTFKSKSSRALTPPVPTRFDYSRRSLPPHNKFHSASHGYLVSQGTVHQKDDTSPSFYPQQQQQHDYRISPTSGTNSSSHIYSHLHKEANDGYHRDQHYTYAVQNVNNEKGPAADNCCLGNQTVDKLQELANRSVMSGQCTDMSVLEVFPKACSTFQTSPSKELHDGHQMLLAQTPQPLYLSNCVDCQHGASNHCQNPSRDFLRTPGNRPLSFVKAMEMSETLDWNNENMQQVKISDCGHVNISAMNRTVVCQEPSGEPEQKRHKSDHEISYEISV